MNAVNLAVHDQSEVDKFNNLAHEWWNIDGEFKTLHHINPVRMEFINKYITLDNSVNAIDVGCGGGILTEAIAISGANTTGIDLAPQSIEVAKLHLYESLLTVNYECVELGVKAEQMSGEFDVLTCMEMLEHVPNPEYIIEQCAKLLKSGGMAFFSTLNRTPKSYLFGVLAAEYLLKIIPKGTHEYQKFIKPSELNRLAVKHGLSLLGINGIRYNPFSHYYGLSDNTDINYLVAYRKI